jgi:pimeloyl-ACP methyl ester carboxylesterase
MSVQNPGSAGPDRLGSTPLAELTAQFAYRAQPVQLVEVGAERRDGVVIHDVIYAAPGERLVAAYLVVPDAAGPFAAAIFLHWLGEVDANRGQFVDEAVRLARTGPGLVSLLPQLDFPFASKPQGDATDKTRVIEQVVQLRRGLDLLVESELVKQGPVALVGHDYGGMYATLLGALDRARVQCEVVIAADTTFSNWFINFFLDLDADQAATYAPLFDGVDPVHFLGRGPEGGRLLQYATNDFFIPDQVARVVADAAGPGSTFRTYDCDHAFGLPAAREDRDAFLTASLGLDGSLTAG